MTGTPEMGFRFLSLTLIIGKKKVFVVPGAMKHMHHYSRGVDNAKEDQVVPCTTRRIPRDFGSAIKAYDFG
jgi:hypothetical protein